MSSAARKNARRCYPKLSRTYPLPAARDSGENPDIGRYYRCWYCGYVCNKDRDALGGNATRGGAVYMESYNQSSPWGPDALNARPIGDFLGVDSIVMELDGSGQPKDISHTFEVEGTGCPFCHSLNWRGDY